MLQAPNAIKLRAMNQISKIKITIMRLIISIIIIINIVGGLTMHYNVKLTSTTCNMVHAEEGALMIDGVQ